jgi:hypothetical protein
MATSDLSSSSSLSSNIVEGVSSLISELYEKYTFEELETKCKQLFNTSDKSDFDNMSPVERATYTILNTAITRYFTFKNGFELVKNMYKSYCKSDKIKDSMSDDHHELSKELCLLISEISHNKPYRMAVLQAKIKANSTDQLSVFRRGRAHPKRSRYPIISILGECIPVDIAQNLVYLDQDAGKVDSFIGFIYMEIAYFEKHNKEYDYKTLTEWGDAKADHYSFGIYPIDTCQEEFRNIGCGINYENGDKIYQTVRIKTYLINMDLNPSLDESQYITFLSTQ